MSACRYERTILKKLEINPSPCPSPERRGESSDYSPALSGKGDGGLGQKPLPQPLPGTERGVI